MEKLNNEQLVEIYQKDKCEVIFNELYIRNKGLIYNVKFRYMNNLAIKEEDIDSACHLGFMQAVNGYKMDNGSKFSSFCHQVMINEVNKSIKRSGRKMRNDLDKSFIYLDDVAVNGEASSIIDVIDLSEKDVLFRKDFSDQYEAFEFAKGHVIDKYHPYIIPLLLKETTTYKVASLIGVSRKTVQYTMTRFKRIAKDHFNKQLMEI